MSDELKCPECEHEIQDLHSMKGDEHCLYPDCTCGLNMLEAWTMWSENIQKERTALTAENARLRGLVEEARGALEDIRVGYWVRDVHSGSTWWTEKQVDAALLAKLSEMDKP